MVVMSIGATASLVAIAGCSSDTSTPDAPAPCPAWTAAGDGPDADRNVDLPVREVAPAPCLLNQALHVESDHRVPCVFFEAVRVSDPASGCNVAGRQPYCVGNVIVAAKLAPEFASAQWNAFCEIPQLSGAELQACQNDVNEPTGASGFCYIDPSFTPSWANPQLVAGCPITAKRRVRYVGVPDLPRSGGMVFMYCTG